MTARCPKTGKHAHTTRAAAHRHLQSLLRIGGVRLQTYRCPHCKKWHVGHYSKGRR